MSEVTKIQVKVHRIVFLLTCVALTTLQTLFIREHNRWVGVLSAEHPEWNDETLYQEARRRVIALVQKITFDEV